jgi:excisionase family DNA binding protein
VKANRNEKETQEHWTGDWPPLLRIRQVGWILQISIAHVDELVRSGELPCVRIGGSLRVPRKQLREWIDRLQLANDATAVMSATKPVAVGDPHRSCSGDNAEAS